MTPKTRRRYALWLLVVSLVLGHVNMGAFIGGWISHSAMDAITNYLSWLAITLTAADLLATADVRVEQDEQPS